MNLDFGNLPSGSYNMLQLKGKNTSEATPESMESFSNSLGGYAVPTIAVILLHSLHKHYP